VRCAASTQAWATSRPIPGSRTLRRALRKYSPPLPHKSTSASTAASAGRLVLNFAAARPIAPMKQADQPAANSCSGLVPLPGVPGDESLISRRPSELLDAAGAHGGAIAHEANRLAIPLGIDPVDRILEHRGGSVVIFGRDEDETVGLRDRSGPFLNHFVREGGTARRGRRCYLIEERHRKIAKIEKPRVDPFALLQMLQDPLRGLFREAALAGASNNNGNDGHVFIPCYSPKERRSVDKRNRPSGGPSRIDDSHDVRSIRMSALGRRVVRCRLHHSAIVPAPSSAD